MKNQNLILIMCMAIILSSCTQRILDFTLISTKNMDLSKMASYERGKQRTQGSDMVHWIIAFPMGRVSTKEAVDRCIESTPGCVALLDGVIYSRFWWIPYIYGQNTLIVEGMPLINPGLVYKDNGMPTYGEIKLDGNGEIVDVKDISSTEFFALKDKISKHSEKQKIY